jgi:hypothetical protein
VTIEGDGFMPNNTRLYIANTGYMSLTTITYSQIIFTTPPRTINLDMDLPVTVIVGSNQTSACLTQSCTFSWSTSVTPYLDSVTPESILGPTNLTFTGRNFPGGGNTYTDVHLTINNSSCIVTAMNNESINCSIDGVEVGLYQVFGSIDGLSFSFFLKPISKLMF